MFFWTPPHTWALATRYREDYARAGVPMLPVVAPARRVAVEITVYTWLTVAASLALWPLATGWVYGVLAALAGAGADRRPRTGCCTPPGAAGAIAKPMQFFHLSNSYLAFVFVAVALDTFVR